MIDNESLPSPITSRRKPNRIARLLFGPFAEELARVAEEIEVLRSDAARKALELEKLRMAIAGLDIRLRSQADEQVKIANALMERIERPRIDD